ncbi:50S ribosomal protein L4 [Aliifodinibius salipaludis]|uniref:Large ribosomal subunit protein uL4 n=1 Tax=Fodinibius salipaludis TaxID=2032627 RepID=A0A2A2G4V6_9BACT|nr:50S ribosomal protein L4 [Aliifodinibius salipaludis]PAU92671.1 50S ribosomal protein L4 [Aliifodinibius salipaludis]
MKLPILTTEGKDSGDKVELADSIFGIEPNETAIYEDVRRYMANQRQGTSNTKERGQVRGGGRKAYRQKGTGQARRGSIRSPLLKGGGTVFGPSPRDHSFKISKKTKRLARKSAWSAKAADEAITIVDDFSFEEPKTRKVADILKSLDIEEQKVLILTADTDKVLYKSVRNIPNVELLEANKPTTYQILDADVILIQESAVEVLQGSIESAEEAVA